MARRRARANRASIRIRGRARGLDEDQRHQPDCFWHVLRREWVDYPSAAVECKRVWVAGGGIVAIALCVYNYVWIELHADECISTSLPRIFFCLSLQKKLDSPPTTDLVYPTHKWLYEK